MGDARRSIHVISGPDSRGAASLAAVPALLPSNATAAAAAEATGAATAEAATAEAATAEAATAEAANSETSGDDGKDAEEGGGGGSKEERVGRGDDDGPTGGDAVDEEEEEEEEEKDFDSSGWVGSAAFVQDDPDSSAKDGDFEFEAAMTRGRTARSTWQIGLCVGQWSRWHFSLQ